MKIYVQSPSNIAWIKYMGKLDTGANLPENPSLSMTLNHLATHLILETDAGSSPAWAPLEKNPAKDNERSDAIRFFAPRLSDGGREKFFRHVDRVRREIQPSLARWDFGFTDRLGAGNYRILSSNTFPSGAGIASSASSFSALTLAVAAACATDPPAFLRAYEESTEIRHTLAAISRQGSGSSCRSFGGPFVTWDHDQVRESSSDQCMDLTHFVLLISDREKEVSSSEAHARIKTSPLWQGRKARVQERLAGISAALARSDWYAVARSAWQEFWEMHSLFHTSQPPFSYWLPRTLAVLKEWDPAAHADSPVITMDAGANIHFTVPTSRASAVRMRLQNEFPDLAILEDQVTSANRGARARILA